MGSACQIGSELGDAWEAPAKSAVSWETHGKQPPNRQRPGRYMGSNRQIGSDRGDAWESPAQMAGRGEKHGKGVGAFGWVPKCL